MRRRSLLCSVSAAAASIAGCSASSDNKDAPSDSENGILGEPIWEHSVPGQSLILSDNTVFGQEVSPSADQQEDLSDLDISGGVFSLDTETGEHQWTYGSSNSMSRIAPRAVTDAVYVTKSSDDASSWTSAVEFNGTERWSGIDGSLTYITDNTAYLIEGYSRGDPIVRAIDTSDGSEIWNAPGSSIEPETAATNTPDTVYVAGDQLVALDTAEGSVRWRYEHGDAESDIHVVSNGTAYVTLDREVVVAASGGEELWRVESLSWPNIHAPTDSAVLVTDQNHTRALDAVTGEQQWVQPL